QEKTSRSLNTKNVQVSTQERTSRSQLKKERPGLNSRKNVRVPHPSRPHREGWDVGCSDSDSHRPKALPTDKEMPRSITSLIFLLITIPIGLAVRLLPLHL